MQDPSVRHDEAYKIADPRYLAQNDADALLKSRLAIDEAYVLMRKVDEQLRTSAKISPHPMDI